MVSGSRELTRGVAAYLACLAFALAFLVATATGGSGMTATIRGAVVALLTMIVGKALLHPLMSTILDAMARDRAQREEKP